MIHKKVRSSVVFWLYYFVQVVSISKLGGIIFNALRRYRSPIKNKKVGRIQKIYWHFYLLRYAYYLNDETIQQLLSSDTVVKITTVDDYDYAFWNNCFMTNCMTHILYEMANNRIPEIRDRFHIFESFYRQPFANLVSGPKKELVEDLGHLSFNFKYAPYSKISLKAWQNAYKYCVQYNYRTEAYISGEVTELLEGRKVLGVICRGTDYVRIEPKGHNRQPSVEEVIESAKNLVDKYGYDYLYVASEEKKIVSKFKEEFPGMVLENKRTYYDEKMTEENLTYITEVNFERENDTYLKGLEYMSSMTILSRCDALIGGNCGGTRYALFLNGGSYSYIQVFDKGLY